jgi:hypothetical protein
MNADQLRALMSKTIDDLHAGAIPAAHANVITRAIGKRLAVIGAATKAEKLSRKTSR